MYTLKDLTPKEGQIRTEWPSIEAFVRETAGYNKKNITTVARDFKGMVEKSDGWYFPYRSCCLHKWWGHKFEITYIPKPDHKKKEIPQSPQINATQLMKNITHSIEMAQDFTDVSKEILRQSALAIMKGGTEYFYKRAEIDIMRNEFADDILITEIKNDLDEVFCWAIKLDNRKFPM